MRTVFTPLFDEVTRYFYSYFGNLPADVYLRDSLAVKSNLERVSPNTTVLVIASHGEPDRIYGDGYTVAVDRNNIWVFRRKIVIVIACHTAQTLGRLAIDDGAYIYFGFVEPFVFPILSLENPLMDRYANAVLTPFWNFAYKVLRGYDVYRAFDELQREIDRTIDEWSKSNDQFADFVIKSLIWNKNNMVLLVNEQYRHQIVRAEVETDKSKMAGMFLGMFMLMLVEPESTALLNFMITTTATLGSLLFSKT